MLRSMNEIGQYKKGPGRQVRKCLYFFIEPGHYVQCPGVVLSNIKIYILHIKIIK